MGMRCFIRAPSPILDPSLIVTPLYVNIELDLLLLLFVLNPWGIVKESEFKTKLSHGLGTPWKPDKTLSG